MYKIHGKEEPPLLMLLGDILEHYQRFKIEIDAMVMNKLQNKEIEELRFMGGSDVGLKRERDIGIKMIREIGVNGVVRKVLEA